MNSYFENLEVWKKSYNLAVRLYELLKNSREYEFKHQMLRSAISIPSNIAEGSSNRDFQGFLNIAKGSAAELRTQVYISQKVKIFNDIVAEELINELKSISKMLQALHKSLGERG